MTNDVQNFVDDIFYIVKPIKKRRSSLEVLQSQLKKSWWCEGCHGDYELWNRNDCGQSWVFTTISEMRDYCRNMNLIK